MNTPLEYNGRPATFHAKTGLALDDIGDPILLVDDATLTVCAWHDADKSLTKLIKSAGYKVSHGICGEHQAEQLAEAKRYREETTMTDDEHAELCRARNSIIRNDDL
jgi:NurA-like 5'-3' nuclease